MREQSVDCPRLQVNFDKSGKDENYKYAGTRFLHPRFCVQPVRIFVALVKIADVMDSEKEKD